MSADQDGRGVPVPIVVTGCVGCPFGREVEGTPPEVECTHPEAGGRLRDFRHPPPSWCPLRSNPALVVLRTEVPK